jgi:hypothetical protein
MTSEQICDPLSVTELHDFALKLQDLWGRLTPKEQSFFGRLLAPAADTQDGEVQGYDFGFGFGGIAEALANSGFHVLSLEPHAATPVPSATGGATVGGGTNPPARMS